MKLKGTYKWLLFAVSVIAFLFLLQKMFDIGMRHNLNLKAAYVSSHRIDAQLLVLGPCEPLWMVSPQILAKRTGLSCYNLAESHSDFADNYLHLQLYLKNNQAPKFLLLFVTPESFDPNYNTFHSYRFAPFLGRGKLASVVAESDPGYAHWRYFPFMRYGYYSHETFFTALQGWKHYLTGKEHPYYPDGFEPPAKMVWDNHHEDLKKLYPKGYRFSWDEKRKRDMVSIIRLCEEKKIELILYESPILQEIRDYQVNRQEILDRVGAIAGGLPYLRFEDLSWARDRKYFISPMVTTLEGSYLFSDTLGVLLRDKYVK